MKQRLRNSQFHFVGIGGIGMCGLAELLHNMGAIVTGSDQNENANTEHLKKVGLKIYKGHQAQNIGDVDVVVYSSAVRMENPEIIECRRKKIPLMPRAEALAEIMRLKRGLAVAGTHGKTTTTAMAAAIFLEAQFNPTIVVGGRLDLIQSTALLGEGEWLIAEADESDGSFRKLSPEVSIITNIDSDHLDFYKNFANLQKAFFAFAEKIPFYGCGIVCGDDAKVRSLFQDFHKRIYFYGFAPENDYVLSGEKGQYSLTKQGQAFGDFQLNVPGRHNALNATAALLSAIEAGIDFQTCARGLLRFQGVDRRFHFKGEKRNIQIYDDYGHHPTEVAATLQALREKFPDRRLVVFFQPHRYTRTESCWRDFTKCFSECDAVLLTDIYPAGEKPIVGINSQKLALDVEHQNCQYIPQSENISDLIVQQLQSGDVFLTLGAGDNWKVGMKVLEKL